MPIPHANYRMQLAGMIEIEKQIASGDALSRDENMLREVAVKIWDAMWKAGPKNTQPELKE